MGSNSHDVPLPLWADESQEAAEVAPAEGPGVKRRRAQRLWSIEEVAEYLGVPKQTVYSWRQTGYGPAAIKVGKHLRYREATVLAWTAEQEEA
ncbi:helix-turn-helix transcriptional regulator [Nocardioides zeae]